MLPVRPRIRSDRVPHGKEGIGVERVALGDHKNACREGHVSDLNPQVLVERMRVLIQTFVSFGNLPKELPNELAERPRN
jgi:hypothetical protein